MATRAEGRGLDRGVMTIASVVMIGAIMTILDTTIVNVAIDTLAQDFRAPLSTVQWVATGYMLALATVIPIAGWASERFGARRVWMTSIVLFVIGSVLAGLSWSIESLIAFRVLQGLGGGLIMPVGMSIMAQAAGPDRMGRVMSLLGVPLLLGPVLGPVLGGVLVQYVDWRWIFFVNVPVGIVALVAASAKLPRNAPKRAERLDLLGLLLVSPGMAFLVYGLSETASSGGLGEPGAVIGLVGGAILITAFVLHALRHPHPLIDVRLFRSRAVSAAASTTFLVGAAVFGVMILLPLYYQQVRGYGALGAGLLLAPQGLGAAAAMPIAGRLTDRIGARPVVIAGIGLAVAGTIAFTQVTPQSSLAVLSVSLVVRGLGLGSTMMPAMAAAYGALTRDEVPRATSALNIVQRVGGSVGSALLAVILQQNISAALPGSVGAEAAGSVPPAVRERVAEPLSSAFGETFWIALVLTVVAVIPALFLPRKAPASGETPGAVPAVAGHG